MERYCKREGHRKKIQRGIKKVVWVCLDCDLDIVRRYQTTEKGKASQKKYRRSFKRKLVDARSGKKYNDSARGSLTRLLQRVERRHGGL